MPWGRGQMALFSKCLLWQMSCLLLRLSVEWSTTKFGYQVLTLKLQCCQGQLAWFPVVTCLVSSGNNISSLASPTMKARQILKRGKWPRPVLLCCFARFASYDVKGRQVASGNEASCPWLQHHFSVKTWWPNFVAPYSTDNRSIVLSTLLADKAEHLALVVRKVDNAIQRINHSPVDSLVCFVNTYPLDSDLSSG